jgi:hypothetical protein
LAFLKFQRDKRGVENFFIVHSTTNRRGKVRPRVLYWFRSPPDLKIGRQPFEAATRRALEAQHPDVSFDWRAIVETPIPSADADKWRERRRAEKAAKHAAAAEAAAEAVEMTDADPESAADEIAVEPVLVSPVIDDESAILLTSASSQDVSNDAGRDSARDANRKRRRRRRGGGGRSPSKALGTGPSTELVTGDGDAPTVTAPTPPPDTEPSGD